MPSPSPTVGRVVVADIDTYADAFPILKGRDFILGKTPDWSTQVDKTSTGRQFFQQNYSSPIWRFKLRHNVLRETALYAEVQRLHAFFNSRAGRYGFFFFYDPNDNTVTNQNIGTGDGSNKVFQLTRTLAPTAPASFTEPVYAVWNTPTVTVNGVAKTYTTDYTIGPWGVVTFVTAPPAGQAVAWSGTFLFVCGFLQDSLTVEQLVSTLWSQSGLEFETRKP